MTNEELEAMGKLNMCRFNRDAHLDARLSNGVHSTAHTHTVARAYVRAVCEIVRAACSGS